MSNSKAIFLDRDGVINKKASEGDYIKSWEEFEFLPKAKKAIIEDSVANETTGRSRVGALSPTETEWHRGHSLHTFL